MMLSENPDFEEFSGRQHLDLSESQQHKQFDLKMGDIRNISKQIKSFKNWADWADWADKDDWAVGVGDVHFS